MNIIVSGIHTEVGKTVVSAVVATLLEADYWKPIQSGEETDSAVMKTLLPSSKHKVHSSVYSLKAPLSPHHAARLENVTIDPQKFRLPKTKKPLIIEMAGGVFVPINKEKLSIEVFQSWKAKWILVSKHYLGSINHTLLTIEALKNHGVSILGLVFNGKPNVDSESAILKHARIPLLGRLLPEKTIHVSIIQKYAKKWRQSGIRLLK